MKKHAFYLLTVLAITFFVMSGIMVSYADDEAEEYSGVVENITWKIDVQSGVMELGGRGETKNYQYTTAPWREYSDKIKTLVVLDGITHVGRNTFLDCKNLERVILPSTVKSIGDYAFKNCVSLKSVENSSVLSTLGTESFYCCSALESIDLSGVTKIPSNCFYACYKLSEIGSLGSLAEIGTAAFYYCISLPDFKADDLKILSSYAFAYCTSLKNVSVNSVTVMGASAFENCTSLERVAFDSLMSMGEKAFYGCNQLIKKSNLVHYINDWVVGCDSDVRELVVPEGAKGIAKRAFAGCREMISAELPQSVKSSIGYECFYGCSSLESLSLYIDEIVSSEYYTWNAYYGNIQHYSMFNIGMLFGIENSFSNSKSYVSHHHQNWPSEGTFTAGSGYKDTLYIPYSLKSITIYGGYISAAIFYNLPVENVYIDVENTEWCRTYPNGYTIHYGDAWDFERYSYNVNKLQLSWRFDESSMILYIDGLGRMPDYKEGEAPWAEYAESIKAVKISGIDTVGANAFYNCTSLERIDLSGIKKVGNGAFKNSGLNSLYVDLSAPAMGDGVFAGSKLENVMFEADSVPDNWSDGWNFGCDAKLHFSSIWHTTDQRHCHKCSDPSCTIEEAHFFAEKELVCSICGYFKNGFVQVEGGMIYYENGVAKTGWFYIGDMLCYADPESKIAVCYNSFIDGLFYIWDDNKGLTLGNGFVEVEGGTICFENGLQVIGWRHADGSGPKVENDIYEQYSKNPDKLYYFLSTTGYMITDGSYTLGGYLREFNEDHTVKPLNGLQNRYGHLYYYVDGECQVGWHTIEGNTYYFLQGSQEVYGRAATKWMYIGNKVYYFYASTSATPYALKNQGTIGGILYEYNQDGSIKYNGFVNCEYANAANSNIAPNIQKINGTTRYYVDGEMQTGWTEINGETYYFYAMGSANGSGYMCITSRYIGGVWYEFTEDGKRIYNSCTINGHKWQEATCTEPQTCTVCGKILGEVIPHTYENGGCIYCGKFEEKLSYKLNSTRDGYIVLGIGNITTISDIVIPELYNGKPVTAIGEKAFYDCGNITSIVMPDTVKTIGNSAFYGCVKLKSIKISDSVTSIGEYAFYNCQALKNLELPDTVTTIGNSVFRCCYILTNFKIPNTVTTIGEYAFYNCQGLKNLDIPDSVTSIGKQAFFNCMALESVTISKNITSIDVYTFACCKKLTSVVIPEGVTDIGEYAFYYCSDLISIELPDSVTNIANNAFYNCSDLKSIVIPKGVTVINPHTFRDCSSLETVVIPDSVTKIRGGAFWNCYNLKNLVIPNSVTWIYSHAFENAGLTSVVIPNSVEILEEGAFATAKLKKIYCEAPSKPSGWEDRWCYSNATVYWGYAPQ